MLDFFESLLVTVLCVALYVLINMTSATIMNPPQIYNINNSKYLVYQGVTYIEYKSVEIEVVSIQTRLKEK